MDKEISSEDIERVTLLKIVSGESLKALDYDQLKRLEALVQKKDYSHDKKAHKSKVKLLAKINVRIYELQEGREGI